jgi:26S proteasome regulatory subunit T6
VFFVVGVSGGSGSGRVEMAESGARPSTNEGIQQYYHTKIDELQLAVGEKTQNVRRLEAQRNELNAKVRLLHEELQLLQEQGSHVGEVIKPMNKKKVLVKVSLLP